MDFPNIYPFIINDPSEGAQAKRRSYCCIVDHLTPAYTNADLYEDLSEVERAVADYTETARQDPDKLPIAGAQLWEAVERADLQNDLAITRREAFADMRAFLARLHSYLSELADTMIGDGLHVLGQPPAGGPACRIPGPVDAPSQRRRSLTPRRTDSHHGSSI